MLTKADVDRLLAEKSAENRGEIVQKIAGSLDAGLLTLREREIAQDIFRILAHDVATAVRELMSSCLKESAHLPRDVAQTLARDIESVSLPVLEYSHVLSDDDLISLVRSESEPKQSAIARRLRLSRSVSEAIADCGSEGAVATLVQNETAAIPEQAFDRIVERHGDSTAVQGAITFRSQVPLPIVERLVNKVAEDLRNHLMDRHPLSVDVVADVVLQAREKAVLGLSAGAGEDALAELVEQLARNQRLTPSLILRALCIGDLPFAEAAFAELAGVSIVNAHVLMQDPSSQGVIGIYRRSGLPESYYPAIEAAIEVARDTEYDDGERYHRRVMERILTSYEQLGMAFDDDDLDYVMGRLEAAPLATVDA